MYTSNVGFIQDFSYESDNRINFTHRNSNFDSGRFFSIPVESSSKYIYLDVEISFFVKVPQIIPNQFIDIINITKMSAMKFNDCKNDRTELIMYDHLDTSHDPYLDVRDTFDDLSEDKNKIIEQFSIRYQSFGNDLSDKDMETEIKCLPKGIQKVRIGIRKLFSLNSNVNDFTLGQSDDELKGDEDFIHYQVVFGLVSARDAKQNDILQRDLPYEMIGYMSISK